VENFVNLFRATHLFNQESQELTKHFRDDCCLPAEIVSRMLAFQDYTNAISKTAKLCDLLTNFITDAKREISELSQKIADENAELLRLMSSAKTHSDPDSLTAEFASVRDKLALIGISTIAGPPSLDSTRFWRASIETRLSESQRRSGQLSQLVDDLSQLPKSRSELADKQMQLSKKEAELTEAEKNRSMAEESLKVAERRMAELNSSLEAAQNRLASLNWHKANKPVYVQLLNKNQILTEDLGRIALLLPSLRIAQESASNEFKSLETVSKQISSKIDGKINAQNTVNRLIGELPTWQTNQTKLTSFAEAEAALQTSVKALGALEIELLPQISKAREESARLTRQVNEADKNQGELKVLLSQIQSYIESGTCPLCGEDHGAKNELLSRVQRNLQSDSAGSARIDLGVVREKISRLERDLADVKEKQQSTTDQIAVMKREQLALDTQINDFLREVADVGFLSDAPSNLAAFLDQIAKDIENEISVLKSQLRNTNDSLETLKSKFVATQDALSKELHEEAEKKALFIRNAEELSSLRNDSRWKQFSLDIADDQRVNEEQGLSAQLTQIRAEMGNAQTALPKLKEQHAGFRQTHTAFKDQAQVLRTSLIALQKSIAQTVVKLEEAKIPTGITREQILELVAQETRHQSQLTALRDSATSLELALDAVTTSAALTTMQQNVRNKEKFVTTATQKLNQYQPLLTYFSKVSRLLSNQQNDSIANFTNEYGPRTSVIQRRLRSVYGFDELEIQSRESTIRVRVKRNEQELRPTDYFSQSQQQTLLLGLFLTACISQTWSGFSPVFMDDPVTHFDDLNTYAFLDLIIGLLESDSCRRQFIISTCDEKLLQLALQKFGHLGGRAAFYRFDSIGSDGPVVARINHE
jgi:exonuclease SbcC